MDNCDFNCFEDIMKACGYSFDEDGNIGFNNMSDGNGEYGIGCGDIIGGFQNIYPELFVLVGEVIGAVVSEKLPINVQNSFGNWLQLVGQVILTYNAQQQYYQGGPGHYFDPRNYDIANSYAQAHCHNNEYEENRKFQEGGEYKEDGRVRTRRKKKSADYKNGVKDIEKEVNFLRSRIKKLESEINNIKNNS